MSNVTPYLWWHWGEDYDVKVILCHKLQYLVYTEPLRWTSWHRFQCTRQWLVCSQFHFSLHPQADTPPHHQPEQIEKNAHKNFSYQTTGKMSQIFINIKAVGNNTSLAIWHFKVALWLIQKQKIFLNFFFFGTPFWYE